MLNIGVVFTGTCLAFDKLHSKNYNFINPLANGPNQKWYGNGENDECFLEEEETPVPLVWLLRNSKSRNVPLRSCIHVKNDVPLRSHNGAFLHIGGGFSGTCVAFNNLQKSVPFEIQLKQPTHKWRTSTANQTSRHFSAFTLFCTHSVFFCFSLFNWYVTLYHLKYSWNSPLTRKGLRETRVKDKCALGRGGESTTSVAFKNLHFNREQPVCVCQWHQVLALGTNQKNIFKNLQQKSWPIFSTNIFKNLHFNRGQPVAVCWWHQVLVQIWTKNIS